MTSTSQDLTVDVIIIGGGPTGENVADRVVQGGLTAALVERELVGGECSYWACMPTKALLRDAAALRSARALPAAGQAVTGTLDAAAVFARRDEFTSHWKDTGQVEWLTGAGITLVRGHGRITGTRSVTVTADDGTTTDLQARHAVVVSTGSSSSSRRSRASRRSGPGPTARPPAPSPFPIAWRSSAAGWSVPRWRPPTAPSGRR